MHSCLVFWRVRLSDYRLSATGSISFCLERYTNDVETRAISSHCSKIYGQIDNINLPVGLSPAAALPPSCISQNTGTTFFCTISATFWLLFGVNRARLWQNYIKVGRLLALTNGSWPMKLCANFTLFVFSVIHILRILKRLFLYT